MENNIYGDSKFADSLIGKNIHVTTKCFKINIVGILEKYDIYRGEIIYILKVNGSGRIHIGANSPELNMEVLD